MDNTQNPDRSLFKAIFEPNDDNIDHIDQIGEGASLRSLARQLMGAGLNPSHFVVDTWADDGLFWAEVHPELKSDHIEIGVVAVDAVKVLAWEAENDR